jgi:hypothetical protein
MKAKIFCVSGGLAVLINFFSGCGGAAMSKEVKQVTEFKWYAVATAPRDYPMEVINGTFYYKGEDHGTSIPSGGTLDTGWGESASVYVGDDELPPLPDRVEVTFYSYAENQFYRAEFGLPYDSILAKFQQQLRNAPDNLYSEFLLGIAPGGAMSVWIKGPRTTEIYFGQAEKIKMSPSDGFDLPFTSKEQSDHYIESALAESVTPEQLVHIKKNGAPIGIWARYRHLYKWVPTYKDGKISTDKEMIANYLNGEKYRMPTTLIDEMANTSRPLPKELKFSVTLGNKSVFYVIDFEPVELMEAFEKLGAKGEKVFIEFDAQIPVTNMKIRVYNDAKPKDAKAPKEYIELKKFKVDP